MKCVAIFTFLLVTLTRAENKTCIQHSKLRHPLNSSFNKKNSQIIPYSPHNERQEKYEQFKHGGGYLIY